LRIADDALMRRDIAMKFGGMARTAYVAPVVRSLSSSSAWTNAEDGHGVSECGNTA
jgi:hypothetical protein